METEIEKKGFGWLFRRKKIVKMEIELKIETWIDMVTVMEIMI